MTMTQTERIALADHLESLAREYFMLGNEDTRALQKAASALRQSPETRDIERGAAAIFEAIPDDCELVRGLDPTFRAEEICTILARACLASVSTPSPEGLRDEEISAADVLQWMKSRGGVSWRSSITDVEEAIAALSRPSEIEKPADAQKQWCADCGMQADVGQHDGLCVGHLHGFTWLDEKPNIESSCAKEGE